jgi:hypothetical protein
MFVISATMLLRAYYMLLYTLSHLNLKQPYKGAIMSLGFKDEATEVSHPKRRFW